MSSTTDTVSASAIPPAAVSKDSDAIASSPGEEEIFHPGPARHSKWGASTPLYSAGVTIQLVILVSSQLVILVSSPLMMPPPNGWFLSGAALVVLSILSLAWRNSRIHALTATKEEASRHAKSEAELQQKKALLELILATVPDEILIKDRQRKILVASRSYLEDLKLKPENVLGESTDELIPKNLVETSRETDLAVLREGLHLRKEIVANYENGTEKLFEMEKLPLIENGEITGVLGFFRNITERHEAEKRLKEQEILLLHASRLSSMGELVAGIAHEINQPLYSILNYAKAVKNTLDGPLEPNLADASNWTDQILKEAARGGKITKQLRSFVRRAETQLEQACLAAIVRESIDLIAAEARCANVEIQCDLGEKLPAVRVDRVQIQQVLVNLLKNAIEALQDHDVDSRRIVISTRRVPAGVKVAVADNGPGIPSDLKTDILEPFFTTKNEGIGLGLAISNTILEAHAGKLSYETNDWGGATFHFCLSSE